MRYTFVLNLANIVMGVLVLLVWIYYFSNGTWMSTIISFGIGWLLGTIVWKLPEDYLRSKHEID